MATGWAKEGAVQEQIDSTVADAVARARQELARAGAGSSQCAECGEAIDPRRRAALPGVRLCVTCQDEADRRNRRSGGYNRRGSKDSQLR